ncbi:YceI family protein [[Mycobacterium] nativiensis]|uniref:YceI family protein n=1 Tax=[Mycobacterium] nativiensis TaxID=2855503 RepID=A0ABU5XQL0_9MYCO|nr:YceI family protein [Mycolicibacter sp. MYC340]MEB3030270.1 YceI family protein [Mycolicibacter sp. MYC340]
MSTVTTFLSSPGAVGVWNLDTDQSSIRFENGTMWGALKVRGSFTDFTGSGEIKDAKTVTGRVDIKAASIDTGLGTRDHDLRRSNFFNSDRYPDIVVVVNGGEPAGGDAVQLDAELTVKGITGALPLRVDVTPLDDGAVRLNTEATVTRKQFAVEGNFLGMVGNRTRLRASLVFRPATSS